MLNCLEFESMNNSLNIFCVAVEMVSGFMEEGKSRTFLFDARFSISCCTTDDDEGEGCW